MNHSAIFFTAAFGVSVLCATRTRVTLREVRRGLARGRVIAIDRRGSVDGRGFGHERGRVIRSGGGAIIVRVRVERVSHELRHLAPFEGPELEGAQVFNIGPGA